MGRKASEINFPFEAKKKDLPSSGSKEAEEKEKEGEGEAEPFDWKKHLSKCIRLTRKTAAAFGQYLPSFLPSLLT
jgi:hypothetical protein